MWAESNLRRPPLKASWIEWPFLSWVNPLFARLGDITDADIPQLLRSDRSSLLADTLGKAWEREAKHATGDGIALRRALWSAFSAQYLPCGLILLIKSATQLYQTQLLADLIGHLGMVTGQVPTASRSGLATTGTMGEGIGLAIGLALCSLVAAGCHHFLFFLLWRWGMRWRATIMVMVFRKAMRASLPAVSQGGGPSSLVNIVSSDTEVFQKLSQFLIFFLFGWVEVVASCVLLYREMGSASLAGVAVLVALIPVQIFFGRVFKLLRTSTAAATDRRVRAVRQVVSGIKAVKVAAWEEPMHKQLQLARSEELGLVQQASVVRAVNEGIFTAVPAVMGAATFLTRWAQGLDLSSRGIFSSISLFQLMQLMFKFYLLAMEAVAESLASIARLERFLALPETKALRDAPAAVATASDAEIVWAKGLSVTWHEETPAGTVSGSQAAPSDAKTGPGEAESGATTPALALSDVSLTVGRGELHMIVGPVAAGKSTLLLSLLGEAKQQTEEKAATPAPASGSSSACGVRGVTSLCPQEAWVVSGSLRQNVLLSRGGAAEKDGWEGSRDGAGDDAFKSGGVAPSDWLETRFTAAVESTGLDLDAAAFEDGYETMLGAQGKRASGGQKARVNLARAVLDPRADAILLDDPLSAVDARTGRRIMERCVQALLLRRGEFAGEYEAAHAAVDALKGGKGPCVPAVVLATHQLQWLPLADSITVLVGGKVAVSGTPEDIAAALRAQGVEDTTVEDVSEAAAAGAAADSGHERRADTKAFLGNVLRAVTGSVDAAMEATGADDVDVDTTEAPAAAGKAASEPKTATTSVAAAADAGAASKQAEGGETGPGDKPSPKPGKGLETKEEATQGGVKWSTYGAYLSAAAGPWAAAGIAFIFISGALLILTSSIWLSFWAGLTPLEQHLPENEWYAVVYGVIVAVAVVVCLIRMWLFFAAAVGAGQKLHDRALAAVLGAPLRWFEQNPVGRIVSRFSKDLYFIDTLLPLTLEDFVNIMTLIISAVVLVVITNAWLLLAVAPLTWLLLWLRNYYLKTSRQVQRIEAISRSPIFRMLVESLDGLDSVRAYGLQRLLSDRMARIVDGNMSNFFMFLATSRWLGTRLDVCCSIFLAAASIGTVLVRDGSRIDPGLAGLSLSMVIQLTGVLQWCFRQSAMLEVQMVSVERLLELEAIEPEGVRVGTAQELLEDSYPGSCMGVSCCCCASASVASDSSTAAATPAPVSALTVVKKKKSQVTPLPWPTTGMVEFRNVWLRYRPGLPYVLRGVSFGVPPGALVGVIGRTGAGKTTLTAALLRLVQHEERQPADQGEKPELPKGSPVSVTESSIAVAGEDIRRVHLTTLRRGIAVIDQDPTLFAGTLRSNVDPFDDYSDDEILEALRAVQLLEATTARGGLKARIEEGGSNLSVGERQLLCLARNVLRSVRVQVYDEPTAFSDVRTDEKLQEALRVAAAASKSTVFTVAHRLRTVADHSLLIVMDAGRVEEFGSPAWLLEMEHAEQGPEGAWGFKRTGAFRSLVGQLGEAEAKAVRDLAASKIHDGK